MSNDLVVIDEVKNIIKNNQREGILINISIDVPDFAYLVSALLFFKKHEIITDEKQDLEILIQNLIKQTKAELSVKRG